CPASSAGVRLSHRLPHTLMRFSHSFLGRDPLRTGSAVPVNLGCPFVAGFVTETASLADGMLGMKPVTAWIAPTARNVQTKTPPALRIPFSFPYGIHANTGLGRMTTNVALRVTKSWAV